MMNFFHVAYTVKRFGVGKFFECFILNKSFMLTKAGIIWSKWQYKQLWNIIKIKNIKYPFSILIYFKM